VTRGFKTFLGHYFYFCMALLMGALTLWGFSHTVDARLLHARPARPVLLWFHGVAFSAWIVLFITQSALVRVRKVSVHRTLGWLGAALAATMVVSGFVVSVVMIRFDVTVLNMKNVAQFLSILWCDMFVFGACMTLAVYFRKTARIPSSPGFHGQLSAHASRLRQISLHRLPRSVLSSARCADRGWNVARPCSGPPSQQGLSLRFSGDDCAASLCELLGAGKSGLVASHNADDFRTVKWSAAVDQRRFGRWTLGSVLTNPN
jgi:hypothetical protein